MIVLPSRETPEWRMFLSRKRRADVAAERVEPFGERALHVDLQQEVHAAAQVEPEIHRQRADPGEPVRRRRRAG